MNLTRHCALCENRITSLAVGLTCNLTKRVPDFYKTCSNINLDKKFEEDLHQANLALYLLLRKKRVTYSKIFLLAITGILIVVGSGILTDALRPLRYYGAYRATVIGIGVLIFIGANFRLQWFLNQVKTTRLKKTKIDKVLDKYGISYESVFDCKEEIHGDQEVIITMVYKNWKKQCTTTSYTSTKTSFY